MENYEIKSVPFMGDKLMAARDNCGKIWVGIHWMCDGIGLTEGQRKKQIANIQADRVLSRGGSNLILPTNSGKQNVFCLNLEYVPLWLAKINITPGMEQNAPEVADKLEQYQLKVKDVLADAFLPRKEQGSILTPAQLMAEQSRLIAGQAQILVDMEKRMDAMTQRANALEAKVDKAVKVFSRPSLDHWKEDMDAAITDLCTQQHLSLTRTRGKLYKELEEKAACNIASRQTHLRKRKAAAGTKYKDLMAVTKLDVIADDKQLRAIFESIVREWQARYAAQPNILPIINVLEAAGREAAL